MSNLVRNLDDPLMNRRIARVIYAPGPSPTERYYAFCASGTIEERFHLFYQVAQEILPEALTVTYSHNSLPELDESGPFRYFFVVPDRDAIRIKTHLYDIFAAMAQKDPDSIELTAKKTAIPEVTI